MDIRVVGSNMEVGASLTNHVTSRLEVNVKKYFNNAVNADVFFTKGKSGFEVNIVVNEGVSNINVRSNAKSDDVYSCFENALEKAGKQLRRYKKKIKTYRRSQGGFKSVDVSEKAFHAPKYIIPAVPHELFEEIEMEELEVMKSNESLNIIEEKTTQVEELTVDEAIMKMDLSNLPALVFINKDNNRINVVYNRQDGNVSWIDPALNK
ncbi:ribosome-associated translation inhibitor RaiA [Rickettsiales bacterium]|nr:ribosome-associated translation inhibitor RaiA [Rickettsiales bacterium]